MRRLSLAVAIGTLAWTTYGVAQTRSAAAAPPDLDGVYVTIPNTVTLPGGLRNTGSPAEIVLTADATRRMKDVDLKRDPSKLCQIIGPFRMMARDQVKIEIVPALHHDMIAMFFEDAAHGQMRVINMNRPHPTPPDPNWLGHSTGRWEQDTLVVDTVAFNDRTWLNDRGAPHSEALHLVERIRLVVGGKYLEVGVTADDPGALAKPYTYVRYFEKVAMEMGEDICDVEL